MLSFLSSMAQGVLNMFRWRNSNRGIPTKDGIYCPLHNKVYSSEADLEPRQFRNRPAEDNVMWHWGCGRGMSRGRGFGRRRGLGRGWFGWPRGRFF